MLVPAILDREHDNLNCVFWFVYPEGYTLNQSDFIVKSMGSERYDDESPDAIRCHIATLHGEEWRAVEGYVGAGIGSEGVYIGCEADHFATKLAFPIDKRMMAKDINGATIVYPNSDNDGWLFAHATKTDHIDRIWLASTAMSSIFDRVMEDRLQQTLASIINNPQTNQQRGVYLKWADMLDFKKDCTAYCVRFEKLLYLGQHKQQAGLNLRDMLLLCIKHVKTEWQKVEDKFDGVAGDVNGIIAALEADHDFETRWEQEARQKREAAARAAAESGTEDQ